MNSARIVVVAGLLVGSLAVAGAQQILQRPGVHPISGRVYALPMSVAGADWLDRGEREQEEEPTRALVQLRIPRGATVADVGAGSGYMTEKLAGIVGPTGRVFANDIQPGMLQLLQTRLMRRNITNVTPILGEPADPKLPANTFDLILMVDVYHELADPQTMLAHLKRALRPEGRLVLFEYKGEDPSIPIRPEHKMTIAQARQELEHEGFRLADVNRTLPRQHVLVFVPERAPAP
jgi:ubiquinone/menaquinone biosynthesis C-methylase UbiE